jgi:octaprenyl-diphosphate synthase
MNRTAFQDVLPLIAFDLERFESEYRSQFRSPDASLQPIFTYVERLRGKRLRPLITFLAQGLVRPSAARNIRIAVLLELLHTSSLLHDDVVDGADLRRGVRSLNAVAGNKRSVLAGDFLMAHMLDLALRMNIPGLLAVLSRTLLGMTRSELLQTEMIRLESLSEALYLDIVSGKTAGLFEAAGELAARAQKASESDAERLGRFGHAFGMAFQIRDDIQDITGNAEAIGKPIGKDLDNGQLTLPLLLAVERSDPDDRARCLEVLKRFSPGDGEWIRDFIRRMHGVEEAEARAAAYARDAVSELDSFPDSEFKHALTRLCDIEPENSP